jgi:hypothetical protein
VEGVQIIVFPTHVQVQDMAGKDVTAPCAELWFIPSLHVIETFEPRDTSIVPFDGNVLLTLGGRKSRLSYAHVSFKLLGPFQPPNTIVRLLSLSYANPDIPLYAAFETGYIIVQLSDL